MITSLLNKLAPKQEKYTGEWSIVQKGNKYYITDQRDTFPCNSLPHAQALCAKSNNIDSWMVK